MLIFSEILLLSKSSVKEFSVGFQLRLLFCEMWNSDGKSYTLRERPLGSQNL